MHLAFKHQPNKTCVDRFHTPDCVSGVLDRVFRKTPQCPIWFTAFPVPVHKTSVSRWNPDQSRNAKGASSSFGFVKPNIMFHEISMKFEVHFRCLHHIKIINKHKDVKRVNSYPACPCSQTTLPVILAFCYLYLFPKYAPKKRNVDRRLNRHEWLTAHGRQTDYGLF